LGAKFQARRGRRGACRNSLNKTGYQPGELMRGGAANPKMRSKIQNVTGE